MMKMLFACLLLLILAGCSKESGNNSTKPKEPAVQKPFIDPSQIQVVETAEEKDRKGIHAQAKDLFATKNYKGLEDLASQYRSSKESYPDGIWKLSEVYKGINLDQEAPETQWKTHLAVLQDWVQTRPKSITARIALANALITYAWKARGSGYADTVTDQGWNLLGERLTEAVQVLRDAESLSEKCPGQWSLLMSAALGLGPKRSQYEAIFQQATNSEPGYIGYYYNKGYYLTQRWHGKPGELSEFIKKSADERGGEEGDLLYARVAWNLQGTLDIFIECDLSWERVDRGFQVMEKRFPDSVYVKNGRAYMAVMASANKKTTQMLIAALNSKIDPRVWTSKENFVRLTNDL